MIPTSSTDRAAWRQTFSTATAPAIAGALATLVQYGLPDDFYDTYRDHMRAVTSDDVLRVAQTHLRPSAMQMLVVGDANAIQKPLEAVGFGPITVYDTEGHLV